MRIKHKIGAKFISICEQISRENLDLKGWNQIESCDELQTDNYCGGFDGSENEFTFSYYDENRKEFWFQLPLADIDLVVKGIITEVEMREAE